MPGLDVQFYDTSTPSGAVVDWFWDFGDGFSDTIPDPLHTFPAPGTYDVTLYVAGLNGSQSQITRPVDVTGDVYPAPAVRSVWEFSVAGLTATFSDQSFGLGGEYVTSWLWNFDDGTTSTEQNPIHIYTIDATYQVSLEVAGNFGTTDILFHNVSFPTTHHCYEWTQTQFLPEWEQATVGQNTPSSFFQKVIDLPHLTHVEFTYTWNGLDNTGTAGAAIIFDGNQVTLEQPLEELSPHTLVWDGDLAPFQVIVGANTDPIDGAGRITVTHILLRYTGLDAGYSGGSVC